MSHNQEEETAKSFDFCLFGNRGLVKVDLKEEPDASVVREKTGSVKYSKNKDIIEKDDDSDDEERKKRASLVAVDAAWVFHQSKERWEANLWPKKVVHLKAGKPGGKYLYEQLRPNVGSSSPLASRTT